MLDYMMIRILAVSFIVWLEDIVNRRKRASGREGRMYIVSTIKKKNCRGGNVVL